MSKKEIVEIEKEDMDELVCVIRTFRFIYGDKYFGICPKCKEYVLINGYVCFGCKYDITNKN